MKQKSIRYLLFFLLVQAAPFHLYATVPNTVVATINVGITPAGLAITPDSRFAYVANNNNYGVMNGLNNGDSVSVIDLSNNTVVTTIFDARFNQPYTVTINAVGTKAYVTNSNGTTVSIIDIATNTVDDTIDDFDGPSGMAINPSGTVGYVNNYGTTPGVGSGNGHTVSVVDLNTNMITGTIELGVAPAAAPAALAMSPDGAHVYVANYVDGNVGTGTIKIIQTSDNTVVAPTITGLSGPFAIVITADGNYAYVTNFGSNNFTPIGTTVSVVDLATNTIIKTLTLGIQPSGIAITPDGRLAYVSNYNAVYANNAVGPDQYTDLTPGQGTVNIIDLATNTVLPLTIAVDQAPDAIAISPNGEFAYVSNFISNTVNVIALQSFYIAAQGCKTENIFFMQKDIINKLSWTASGSSLPVSYSIYRDAALSDLVATIPAIAPYQFLDHNRQSNQVYTYYIVGTNEAGTTSDPVAVTVTQNC